MRSVTVTDMCKGSWVTTLMLTRRGLEWWNWLYVNMFRQRWSLIRNRSEISGPVVMSVPYPRVILPDDLVQNQVISQQHSYHISAILRRSEEFAHVGRPTGLVWHRLEGSCSCIDSAPTWRFREQVVDQGPHPLALFRLALIVHCARHAGARITEFSPVPTWSLQGCLFSEEVTLRH